MKRARNSITRIFIGLVLATITQRLAIAPGWAFFMGWAAGAMVYEFLLPITTSRAPEGSQ